MFVNDAFRIGLRDLLNVDDRCAAGEGARREGGCKRENAGEGDMSSSWGINFQVRQRDGFTDGSVFDTSSRCRVRKRVAERAVCQLAMSWLHRVMGDPTENIDDAVEADEGADHEEIDVYCAKGEAVVAPYSGQHAKGVYMGRHLRDG